MSRFIIGDTTSNSITVWVRSDPAWPFAFVDVVDLATGKPAGKTPIPLEADDFHTGVARCGGLNADTRYLVKASFGRTPNAPPDDGLKFVITSVPFIAEVKSPHRDKWCDPAYDRQRERILRHVLDSGVKRLVFLTGDMHCSCHSTLTVADGNGNSTVVNELMSSPIN